MKMGYAPTSDASEADLLLLNTCNIREKANQKVFSRLGAVPSDLRGQAHRQDRPAGLHGSDGGERDLQKGSQGRPGGRVQQLLLLAGAGFEGGEGESARWSTFPRTATACSKPRPAPGRVPTRPSSPSWRGVIASAPFASFPTPGDPSAAGPDATFWPKWRACPPEDFGKSPCSVRPSTPGGTLLERSAHSPICCVG